MNMMEKLSDTMVVPSKAKIIELEEAMRKFPQITPPVDHVFAKGAYMRCISMAAGTVITSKRHKTQHISVVVSGDYLYTSGEAVSDLRIVDISDPLNPVISSTKQIGTPETEVFPITSTTVTNGFIDLVNTPNLSKSFSWICTKLHSSFSNCLQKY